MSSRRAIVRLLMAALLAAGVVAPAQTVRVGSKVFTESVILSELATQAIQARHIPVRHDRQLGGTRLLFDALRDGQIDIYPEYTGTIRQEILHGQDVPDDEAMATVLARLGVAMTPPLGFNNTYAIGMRASEAQRLAIRAISDLKRYPRLRFGFSNEFLDRRDGWPALRQRYDLPQTEVRGLDHDLAYRALASGAIDAMDLYSTDAEIAYYHLRTLDDDLRVFPSYQAVYLYRADLRQRFPQAVTAIAQLEGRIDRNQMIAMNAQAKLDHVPETQVAANFLAQTLNLRRQPQLSGLWTRIGRRTCEHLSLVAVSLAAAIALGVPLGVVAATCPKVGQLILGTVAAIYTIPSLALLVFMIPLLGIGAAPAIVALFLYSLLPIVRNTHAGLRGIPAAIRESAQVLGLPARTRLLRVKLPMASASILAGIQTSAVINVGTATLGALIGAGGYGQPILTGIRLDNLDLILEGAIPSAVLALLVQGAFELASRWLVPRGLRLQRGPA